MSNKIQLNKADVLTRLRDKLVDAAKADKTLKAAHNADEAEWAKDVKVKLRAAATLPYREMKEALGSSYRATENIGIVGAPTCPTLNVPQYKRAIDKLELDRRSEFTVEDNDSLISLLTRDFNPVALTVCD